MKKPLISILLIIVLSLSIAAPCLALGSYNSSNRASLEEVKAYIQKMHPGAEVKVDKNNVLQILVSAPTSNKQTQIESNTLLTSSSIYAPNGGSFRGFSAPAGTDPYGTFPYSCVYLPADQTVALLNGKLKEDLFNQVISLATSGVSISGIVTAIYTTWGVWLGPAGVALLIGIGTYNVMSWIDNAMLVSVTNSNSRISILRTTTMGWPSNYYEGWTSNYVTAAPYESWNPTFYSGVYDI